MYYHEIIYQEKLIYVHLFSEFVLWNVEVCHDISALLCLKKQKNAFIIPKQSETQKPGADRMTTEKDIVIIYFEDTPMGFARIEDITADVKPGWYVVKLLLLKMPVEVAHWILRDSYIDGAEFTMNGKRMRLEKVVCPEDASLSILENGKKKIEKKPSGKTARQNKDAGDENGGQVISLTDRFKK